MELDKEKCESCKPGMVVITTEEAEELLKQMPNWTLKDKAIEREFDFSNFREAIDFVNQVAAIAEAENHHPDIRVSYSKVWITLSTHKIGGLSKNDFVLAAKVSKLV